jgi:hypothetical protein
VPCRSLRSAATASAAGCRLASRAKPSDEERIDHTNVLIASAQVSLPCRSRLYEQKPRKRQALRLYPSKLRRSGCNRLADQRVGFSFGSLESGILPGRGSVGVAHGPPEPTSGRLLRVFHRLRGFACRRTRMLLTLGGDEAEPSDDREWRAEAMKRLVPRAPIAAYTRCRASSAGMGFPRAYRQRVPAQMSASPGAHLRESRRNATCCKQRSNQLAPEADWRRLGARCGSDVRWASRRLLLGACAAGVERSRLSLKAAPRGARGCCHAWLGRRRRLRMSSCRWASVPCGRSTVWRGDE